MYEDSLNKTLTILRNIRADKIAIGFSGGKDSTTLTHLALQSFLPKLEKGEIEIKIVYANTLLEFPNVREWVKKFLTSIQKFVSRESLPIEVKITIPKRDFIYAMVVKEPPNYSLPHWGFPWCRRELKINPVEKEVEGYLQLVGVRADESPRRKGYLNGKKKIFENKVYPLLHWKTEEVLAFLYEEGNPFWSRKVSYRKDLLQKVYFIDKPACNNGCKLLRYGCFICPIAGKRDRKFELNGYGELNKIRELMVKINLDKRNRVKKDGKRWGGLNERGRLLFAMIFYYLYKKYPELFEDYWKYKPEVMGKLIELVENSKEISELCEEFRTRYNYPEICESFNDLL